MKAHARTPDAADFARFGDLAFFGSVRAGEDLAGYAFPAGQSHTTPFVSNGVALLESHAGCFGWRLTSRQAGALARAGFPCLSRR